MAHKIKISFLLVPLLTFLLFVNIPQVVISAEKSIKKIEIKKETTSQKYNINPYAKAKIKTKIIPSANKTFGYEIIVNDKTLVRQPNIPALPGNNGFTTRRRAQKVANFVVKKIRKNEMPPTVTVEDLNKMGVLKKD